MSKRVKIKELKQALNGASTGDINSMFEEMMGVKDAEAYIIVPKFVKTRNLIRRVYKVLMQFCSSSLLQSDFPETQESMEQIKTFATEMKQSVVFSELKGADGKDIDETDDLYAGVSKDDINNLYKKLKTNAYVQRLIVMCGRMKQYSKCFEDINNLKDNFIGQEPGLSLHIFDFSTLDLKKLWVSNKITPFVKKYVLSVLYTIYKDLFSLYKITTSPDVDIDKFTEVLLSSLGQLKKQPGLNRCNNAFKRIEASVELLKGKFDNYYRESVASSNPNMIVESFIIDVSNQGGADARLTREFRQIIQYMHKMSTQNGKNKDPNVQKLFGLLQKNFEIMENKTGKKTSGIDGDEDKDKDVDECSGNSNIDEKSSNLDNMDFSLKDDKDIKDLHVEDTHVDDSSNVLDDIQEDDVEDTNIEDRNGGNGSESGNGNGNSNVQKLDIQEDINEKNNGIKEKSRSVINREKKKHNKKKGAKHITV
jgi:hypothetical protein